MDEIIEMIKEITEKRNPMYMEIEKDGMLYIITCEIREAASQGEENVR